MTLLKTTTLTVPAGNPKDQNLSIELGEIYTVENRIQEVAFVTPHKAPELLARFNEAFLELTRIISMLEYQKNTAEREAGKVRGNIILNKVPEILKEKGLVSSKAPAGSELLRNAVLETDDEYQGMLDRVDQLKASIMWLKGKLDSIEMAYNSTKKILGENVQNVNNPYLKGTGEVRHTTSFGTPKYKDE